MSLHYYRDLTYFDVCYLPEYRTTISPFITPFREGLRRNMDYVSFLKELEDTNIYGSIVFLKERDWDFPSFVQNKAPYLREDLITSYLSNQKANNRMCIYLSRFDTIAKDMVYLKDKRYAKQDIDLFYQDIFHVQLPILHDTIDCVVQAKLDIDDTEVDRYRLIFSKLTERDGELLALECEDFHYTNTLLNPTFKAYNHFSDTNWNMDYEYWKTMGRR